MKMPIPIYAHNRKRVKPFAERHPACACLIITLGFIATLILFVYGFQQF